MSYRVRFVPASDMPDGKDWMVCARGEDAVLCMSDRMLGDSSSIEEKERALEGAWGSFRVMREFVELRAS